MTKKCHIGSFVLLSTLIITGCKANVGKWDYTIQDMENSETFEKANVEYVDGNTFSFSFGTPIALMSETATASDLVLFDAGKLKNEKENYKNDFIPWSEFSKYEIEKKEVQFDGDNKYVNIQFEVEEPSEYAVLIHKNASNFGAYTFVLQQPASSEYYNDPQTAFEEDYIKDGNESIKKSVSDVISLIKSIGDIYIGKASGNSISTYGGIIGVINFAISMIAGIDDESATIADVLKKLDELDSKIQNISKKIQANYVQLNDLNAQIATGINKAILDTQELGIQNFKTYTVNPVKNFMSDYSYELKSTLTNLINSGSYSSIIYLNKDANGKYDFTLNCEAKELSAFTYTFNITSFANSQEDLRQNRGVFKDSTVGAIMKDIAEATKDVTLPSDANFTIAEFNTMIFEKIVDNFMKLYFSDSANVSKVNTIYNLIDNYCNAIKTTDSKSIIDWHYDRLKYTFNFAREAKDALTSIYADLAKQLDQLTSFGTLACRYAGRDTESLITKYKAARDLIADKQAEVQAMDDRYSFVVESNINLTINKMVVNYKNTNDDAFKLAEMVNEWGTKDVKLTDYDSLTDNEIAKIAHRLRIMKISGLASNVNFEQYLEQNFLINVPKRDIINFINKVSKYELNILVENYAPRNMDSSDEGKYIYCADRRSGSWFKVGNEYGYRLNRTRSAWSGRIIEGDFVDLNSGLTVNKEPIAYYAHYDESHWYWRNDEHWTFSSDNNKDRTKFFVILAKVA